MNCCLSHDCCSHPPTFVTYINGELVLKFIIIILTLTHIHAQRQMTGMMLLLSAAHLQQSGRISVFISDFQKLILTVLKIITLKTIQYAYVKLWTTG